MTDPMQPPTGDAPDASPTPTPTSEHHDVREAHAALRRLFDAAKPFVANRRAGKDAMMRDVQTITRALAAVSAAAPDERALADEVEYRIRTAVALAKGAPLLSVSRAVGHASPTTTSIYALTADSDLDLIAEAVSS